MSKSKDAAAMPAILEYLVKQNRPYSAVDIHSNLHKAYGKTAVTKALETLAEEGKVKEKTYGKQKVYVADQSHFPTVDDAELKAMDTKIAAKAHNLRVSEEKQKRLETVLRDLSSSLTTEEAHKQLTELTKQCQQLEEKLSGLKSNKNSVSPEDRQKVMAARTKYVKEWKKRKRMATDMLDAILEGYPKKKRDLYEDIGIETDDDCKVSIPEL